MASGICIIDLCSTPNFLLRDPLLLEFVSGIAEAYSSWSCNTEFVTPITANARKSGRHSAAG